MINTFFKAKGGNLCIKVVGMKLLLLSKEQVE